MRTRNLTLLAAGLAISAAAPTTVLASAFSGADGRIAFSSNRTGNYEIYSMNPDGSDVRQLTNSPRDDAQAAWSPDGTKIAFASNRTGNDEVYVMNADGSGVVNITQNSGNCPPGAEVPSACAADAQPSWSPDGSQIVFTSFRGGGLALWIMNADGSSPRMVSKSGVNPSWSPDGTRIAFTDGVSGGSLLDTDVFVIRPDGQGRANLTNDPKGKEQYPTWSPDGSRIAYSTDVTGRDQIRIMNADGSGQSVVTALAGQNVEPAFSPDGTRISFRSTSGGRSDIWLVYPNGTGAANVTAGQPAGRSVLPNWQPLPAFSSSVSMPVSSGSQGVAVPSVLGNVTSGGSITTGEDGMITGVTTTGGGLNVFRTDDTGMPDTTFGSSGRTRLALRGWVTPSGVALDARGRTLVSGFAMPRGSASATGNSSDDSYAFVARFTTAGVLDRSFGSRGIARVRPGGAAVGAGAGIALDPQGRIVLAGYTTRGDVFVSRLTAAGRTDRSFGRSGSAIRAMGAGQLEAMGSGGVAVDGRSRPLVAFAAADTRRAPARVMRLTARGQWDAAFNRRALAAGVGSVAGSPTVTVAAGNRPVLGLPTSWRRQTVMSVARLQVSGVRDRGFNGTGIVSMGFGSNRDVSSMAVPAVDGSNRLWLSGTALSPSSEGIASARLLWNGNYDRLYGGSGRVLMTRAGTAEFSDVFSAAPGGMGDLVMLAGLSARRGATPSAAFVSMTTVGTPNPLM
jgi:TolB protein